MSPLKQWYYSIQDPRKLADNDYSPITAKLCVKAIGKENVVGVIFTKADGKISVTRRQVKIDELGQDTYIVFDCGTSSTII